MFKAWMALHLMATPFVYGLFFVASIVSYIGASPKAIFAMLLLGVLSFAHLIVTIVLMVLVPVGERISARMQKAD